jgi:hypothetical protein
MATEKATAGSEASPPPSSARPDSHTRVRSPLQRTQEASAQQPSTLPPPPFESETAVPQLEWWLDAHMALASQLLWLGHLVSPVPSGHAQAETVKVLVARAEGVRDALYELYCDAADERLAPLVGRGGALEAQVRASYAWCVLVVKLLATVTTDLRSPAGPDWPAVKRSAAQVSRRCPAARQGLREAVRALPIDFSSPIEPLRNLASDVDQLSSSLSVLNEGLSKRLT